LLPDSNSTQHQEKHESYILLRIPVGVIRFGKL
jgi:hypothetical protein